MSRWIAQLSGIGTPQIDSSTNGNCDYDKSGI